MACPINISNSSGFSMPALGFGTWQAKDKELEEALEAALEAGYRHIDTAAAYENEEIIGRVLKKWIDAGKLTRNDLFIVTKLPAFGNKVEEVQKWMDASLKKLQLDYVDLYLFHFPIKVRVEESGAWVCEPDTDLIGIWKELEKQVDQGKAKAIGVSNFNESQVERVLAAGRIRPVTNQIELHVYLQQHKLIEFLKKKDITVTAYSPLGTPGIKKMYADRGVTIEVPDILNNPVVHKIAKKHQKKTAQIMLRYHIQRGIASIPKSTNPERIKDNIDIFNFTLDEDDIKELQGLDINNRIVNFERMKGALENAEYPFRST